MARQAAQSKLSCGPTGILSGLCGVLAEHKIAVFAVSTYNTDYILVRADQFDRAADAFRAAGYTVT